MRLLPKDVPNGDFSQDAAAPDERLAVKAADPGWEPLGYSSTWEGQVTVPDATVIPDPVEGKAFKLGGATEALLSPWLDLPNNAQVVSLSSRTDQMGSLLLAAVVDRYGSYHSEVTMRPERDWTSQPIPVGDVAGSRVRLRLQPVAVGNATIVVGHISPPQTLLSDWALQQQGGMVDVAVRRDEAGRFVALTQVLSYSSAGLVLETRPFELASSCSSVSLSARSEDARERVDISLFVDGIERWLGPFMVDDSWQRLSLPVADLVGRELRVAIKASPVTEIDIRDVNVTHSCTG